MKRKHSKRTGLFLLDVCVGLAITAVATYVFSLAAFQLSEHRSDRKMRRSAVDTLVNVNETLDFDADIEKQLQPLRETVDRALPGGKLDVTELPETENKEITLYRITVSYDNGANRPRREFHLLRAFEKTPDN